MCVSILFFGGMVETVTCGVDLVGLLGWLIGCCGGWVLLAAEPEHWQREREEKDLLASLFCWAFL